MNKDVDRLYFARRAEEERAAAIRSEHPSVRNAHLVMAARYSELADPTGRRGNVLMLNLPRRSGEAANRLAPVPDESAERR